MSHRLDLPEPAAALLLKTHAILDEHVTPHTPGGEGWKLGGGTVLAARWKHRDSFDLDIQIHPETERGRVVGGRSFAVPVPDRSETGLGSAGQSCAAWQRGRDREGRHARR